MKKYQSNYIEKIAAQIKRMDFFNNVIRRNPIYYYEFKKKFSWLASSSLETRIEFSHRQLTQILRKAINSRYGKTVGHRFNIDEWPFLEKETLRKDSSSILRLPKWCTSHSHTGGSTGTPVALFRSFKSIAVEQVCIDGLLEQINIDPINAKIAVLRGDTIKNPSDFTPPYWKKQNTKKLLFSSHHLNNETVDAYFNELRDFSPDCLMAYPSAVEALCALMSDKNLSFYIPVVLTSSEMLTNRTRELINSTLKSKIIDHYGQAERVAFAANINTSGYYFLPGYSYIELLHTSCEGNTDLYEVIGTPFWNSAMPLVRYRTGDFIRLSHDLSPEELKNVRYGLLPFKSIEGRCDDYIISSNGVRAIGMNHIPRGIKNIIQMQLIQESYKQVRILVVPTKQFSKIDHDAILSNAYSKLSRDIQVSVESVDQLQHTAIGKTPFIIRSPDIK